MTNSKASGRQSASSVAELEAENAELRRQLEEVEETLHAIQSGRVDAFVVNESTGDRVYTLESAERPYRLLVEQMQQGAATLQRDGTIVYCNLSFAELLGIPHETLIGSVLNNFIVSDDRANYERLLEQCSAGVCRGELRLLRSDRDELPVSATFNMLPRDWGASISLLVTDLSPQRRHELRKMELADTQLLQSVSVKLIQEQDIDALYHQILETAIQLMDAQQGSIQFYDKEKSELRLMAFQGTDKGLAAKFDHITIDSQTTCALALKSRLRTIVSDFASPEFQGSSLAKLYLDAGILAAQSTPLVTRSGELLGMMSTQWQRPFNPEPKAFRFLDILVRQAADLIDRRRADQAIKDSEERFRMVADNMSQLAWTCDTLGNITWFNQRWLDYTGMPSKDMEGWEWVKVQHPDHLERVVAGIQRSAENGEPWEDTFPLRGKDGEYRWFLTRAVPIFGGDSKIVRWFGTNTDVTAVREVQESLRDADRRKDEFLATLAHELRNPLAPIQNGLQILQLSGNDESTCEFIYDMMAGQVDQLVRLVDDLLEVSRITRGKIELRKELIDLNEVLQSAVATSKPLIDAAKHSLIVHASSEPLIVDADPVRVSQIITNLLNNAAKYTIEGGKIWLEAKAVADEAVVSIRDTGMGIPEEMLTEIFEPFTQVDRTYTRAQGGLGIGLTLVRNLVNLHGGVVEAFSGGEGKGSEFKVRLPIVSRKSTSPTLPSQRANSVNPRRILVVDDNSDAALTLSMLLKSLGAETHTSHDGVTALEAIQQFRPSVVILDLGMPGMDGYEVARRTRLDSQNSDVVLIALTGWGQDEDRRKSREAGFDHHLVKPVNVETLRSILASLS